MRTCDQTTPGPGFRDDPGGRSAIRSGLPVDQPGPLPPARLRPALGYERASWWRSRRRRSAERGGLLDPEPVEQGLVAPPPAPHAHRQLEVHAPAELALELLACGRPDGLDHPPARADQDPLLRLGLDPHERPDDRDVAAIVDLVDLDLDRVRDLLEGAAQDLLA